jgi:hypothetical protein
MMQLLRLELGLSLGSGILLLTIVILWMSGLVAIGMGVQRGFGKLITKLLLAGLAVSVFSVIVIALGMFLWTVLFVT